MDQLKAIWANLTQRRKFLAITSGGLIAIALVVDFLLDWQSAYNFFMVTAAVVAGYDIAARAVASLRNRHFSIELLVTIAALGALWIGDYWEAAAVTFLFILGAYLEARTLSHTRQVLGKLLDLAPITAFVLREGQQVEVLAHEVENGEIVVVKPGTKVPVDGNVLDGQSSVDESAITGEPMPEEKAAGSLVFAGTLNQNGLLQVQATGIGSDTTLARIIRRVEEAQEEKAPTQRFIERFARWYTPAIILLSVVVYAVTRNIELSLTLLVIGCPGALVISTPVSIVAGIGRAARAGILIKGGEYLENAGQISALALDKTGTLTEGKPRLTEVIPVGLSPDLEILTHNGIWDDAQTSLLGWAAIAESGSEHPLARAILAGVATLGRVPLADHFESRTGRGVKADYAGRKIAVGTLEWMKELEVPVGDKELGILSELKNQGKTAVVVSLDNHNIGILGISDPIRAESAGMVRRLKEIGVKRVLMLTGDDRITALHIAGQAGIDEVRAGLLPEDKLTITRELQQQGYVVAMVGDGINDAPALAAADIGIAMGAAGADVAVETADIALMSDDMMKIPEAIRLSKATLRNIHQNVFIALATVSVLLAGVLLGEVGMAGGMLVHEASVLIVILNGMRLLRM